MAYDIAGIMQGIGDTYKKSRGNYLSKMAFGSNGETRQTALAELAGINPQAALETKKTLEDQDYESLIKASKLLVSLEGNDDLANQAYQRMKPQFTALGLNLPEQLDPTVWQSAKQIAGAGGKAKARSSHILEDGTIAFMDEYGNLTRTKERASNSYGFQTDAQGNVFAQDKRGGTVAPAPMGSVQAPMPQVPQGADPMAGGLERINQTVQVLKDNNVPVAQINAWADAEFAKLQQGVRGGVIQQPQQARVAVASKVKDAPSGYEYKPDGSLAPIAGGPADPAAKPSKSWTPTGLDKYNKVRTDVQVASTLDTMMNDMAALFNDPDFNLGPVQNKRYEFENWSGNSTPQSRAYGKLKSNFEKMRNDSLRLNTGVQTDGDAQRAWAEIFSNMNDKELVKARLADIRRYNEFALNEKRTQLEGFEGEFGVPGGKTKKAPTTPNKRQSLLDKY